MADTNIRAVITAEDRASAVVKNFSSQLSSLGQIAGGVFALDRIIGFGAELVSAFNQSEKATTELNSVLQTTGDVSGVTSKQAEDLASSLGQVTTFSKATTMAAEDVLLRFTNIGQNIFPQVVKSTQDLATGLGIDLTSAAAIVGRALDSPANAARSLRSAQIVLNSSQQEFIKGLVDAGKGAQAQAYILDILQTKFGGLATAVGQTFGGQVQILQNNLELVKERMGEVIADAIGPFIDVISRFVANNGSFITSLGLATLVAGGFAAAVIAVAGAVAIALAVMGPFTIVLLAISALIGGVVFGAMQRFQKQMADTTQGFAAGSKSIASNGANNFGQAGQAAADLARKLADIQRQMDQTNEDFKQSMAQIVQTHEQAVTTLKKQIDDENKAFADAQDTKVSDAQSTNDRIVSDHASKVRDIESQIKDEQIASGQADNARINDLRVRLAQENEAYNKQVADNAAKYKLDADQATEQHQAKLTDFQTKLQQETDFLSKHNDDIRAIQNVQVLDEIDRLKQSHQRQMEAFDRQRDDAIRSAQQTTSGMAGAFNGLPNQINGGLLNGVGTALGQNMAQALKDSFKNTIKNIPEDIYHWSISLGNWLNNLSHGGLVGSAKAPDIEFRAEGGPVQFDKPYIVGENGPELFVPSSSGQIVPGNVQPQAQATTARSEIHVHLEAQAFMGSQIEGRKFAQVIADHLDDIATAKNMTVAQMLGG